MFSLIIGSISLLMFVYFFKKEPNQFKNIFLLMVSFYFGVKGIFFLWRKFFPTLNPDGASYVETNSGTIYFSIFIIFILILIVFSWYLWSNFFTLIRKEGLLLSYYILPFSALSIYIWIFLRFTYRNNFLQEIFNSIILYIPLLYFSYFLYTKLYLRLVKIEDPDYIIIHGAALINDLPTPLLMKRLDKGIEVFNNYNKKAIIIVSGGQGKDEIFSEAEVMKKYLLNKGIPEAKILEENQSRNTFENLLFSKRLISGLNKRVIIVSNEYHILRCVIYAKNIGFKAVVGVPSKTVRYYKIFGEFREVVAFIVRYKTLFPIYILLSIVTLYLDYFMN